MKGGPRRAKRKKGRWWKFVVGGALAGWLAGIFCEGSLAVLWLRWLGYCEEDEFVLALEVAPLFAIFWILPGVATGIATREERSPWVPVVAALCAFAGVFCLAMDNCTCDLHDITVLGGVWGVPAGMVGMGVGVVASGWLGSE